jgi:hypothetical protein
MVCFQTKNPNLGKFWRVFAMEDGGIFYALLAQFTVFCYFLWTFGIVHGDLVHFPLLVHILYKEKSGNPVLRRTDDEWLERGELRVRGDRGPSLTSPLGANFDPRGKVVPQG